MDEATAVLHSLERDARSPAGESGVMQVVGRRFALYPQPERSDDEAAAWWGDYFDVLADVPFGTLEAAMIAWVKTAAEFLPKPGQLFELVSANPGKEALACLRVRAAMRWTPEPPRREPGPFTAVEAPATRQITDADRTTIRQMRADFAAQLPEKPKPMIRAISAKVDAHGVSPELRALVERQRAGT